MICRNPRSRLACLAAAALCALPAATLAQSFTVEPLVLEGDDVPGVGLVTRIHNLAINDAGEWLVEADTDHADTDLDSVLLRDGALYLREGDPLSEPVGATLDSFDSVNLNDAGVSGWNFFLDGTSGSSDDSGIYRDVDLLIQEGDVSMAPEFTQDTPYIGFLDARINDADRILLVASVDDPAIDGTVDRAIVVLELDAAGNLVAESVFAKEGDTLPGQTETVTDFGTGPHESDFNDAGQILFQAELTGDVATNAAVYLDDLLLAQEGSPSPVAGRNWSTLTSIELSINASGDHVYSGSLDGDTSSNLLLVENGAKFRQEGDTLPAISPFLLTSFGSGPVEINDLGQVLWYGDWDDPDTDVDTGLFLDDQLLVQEGVTMVDGLLIDSLSGVQDGYAMSDDGSLILFEATLEDGTDGAFLLTFTEAGLTLSDPMPGIAGQENGFLVTGAGAGSQIGLIAGLVGGSVEVPGCPGVFLEIGDPRALAGAVADANGEAQIVQLIPPQAAGRTLLFQAVDRTECAVSNLVTFTF